MSAIQKILVLFGSSSDEPVTKPLIEALQTKGFTVDLQYVSAHRNPDKLEQILKTTPFDLLITGAGLAAHLPGVSASKTFKPVIGISVELAFGGLDAFLSILQMPPGIPVLTTPTANAKNSAALWKKLASQLESCNQINWNQLSVNWVGPKKILESDLTKKSRAIFAAANILITQSERLIPGACNLVFVPNAKPNAKIKVPKNSLPLFIPIFSKKDFLKPSSALVCLKNIQKFKGAGFWFGANNVVNATCAALEFFNTKGQYQSLLSQVKKGEFRG